jgi:radical SAM superfamily enzyme YgiQ (UPF0313 family)
MLKILFITPHLSREKRYGSLAGGGSSSPSLGILMLAAVARHHGFDCTVIDASALELSEQDLLQRIATIRPDVIGISSPTLAIGNASNIATAVKRLYPDIRIIAGGPHITAAPLETMSRFPALDIAVIGEGEATITELLTVLQDDADPASVQGIVYRNGNNLCDTGRRPKITDLDALPFPAWDLLEGFPQRYLPAPFKVRNLPAATLVTTRGCPNTCIFCDRSVFGSSCHAYSAEYIVREMAELYQRYGIREFSFEDDTFITFKKRLVELCEKLITLKLDISWTCLGRVNHVTADILKLMRAAGCWQISFGIESGSQGILDLVNKGITLDQIRNAADLCQDAGIKSKGFFIIGHPGETRETLRVTLDFALKLPLNDISVSLMTPFPGSEIYDRASEFGTFDANWENMNLLNAVFVPNGLTREELVSAQKVLLKRFYLRPRIIAEYAVRLMQRPSLARGFWNGFKSLLQKLTA